jgi:hypothetical protein
MATYLLTAVTAEGYGFTYTWGDAYEVQAESYDAAEADVLGRVGVNNKPAYARIVKAWVKDGGSWSEMSVMDRGLKALLDSDDQGTPGELPAFAWPGGYPMFYTTAEADALCAKCATAELLSGESSDPPVAYGAYGATEDYPEGDEHCDNCGDVIAEGNKET